jgi:DNA-binding PucR family transcriptional regulator
VVGISREFTDLQDIHRHYNQARDTLGIGVQFRPNEAVYWYEDYADFRLLQAAAQNLDLWDVCHPGIRALYQADRANGTAYLQTLRNYLAHGRSIAAAAADMHIHRNTVSYRVEHCLRTCALDLNNSQNLLHMLLSLLILDYQDSLPTEES